MRLLTTMVTLCAAGFLLVACGEAPRQDNATSQPAQTEQRLNTLRWSAKADALTFDPHAQNETPTLTALTQVYERLIGRAPDLTLVPELATSWEAIEPTVWEVRLRDGVTFHDGTPLTADDVQFSIERALAPTSDFRPLILDITAVEVVDPLTVHLRTGEPSPLLPANLTSILILSRAWAEEHGVTRPQDYAQGEENYAVRNANGTGAFRLERREPGVRTRLTKNEDWWGLADQPHTIDEIIFTPIDNDATRVAALLSGEIDFLLDPPVQDLGRIESTPGLKLDTTPQNRTILLGMNQSREELLTSNIEGRNPFADVRVRRALYQAIDIETIRRVIMRNLAEPAGIIAAPGVNGWTPELDTRLPYDPDAARALLVEAGYPDGFEVELDCPNDRYVNDEAICQAIVGMLARVGVDVTLDAQTKSLHFPKLDNRETDFYLQGWAVATIDSEYVFSFLLVSDRRNNASEYANPVFDALVEDMRRELDPQVRDQLIAEAWEVFKQDVPLIPLHHQVIVWAMRDRLTLPITATNQPLFRWGQLDEDSTP